MGKKKSKPTDGDKQNWDSLRNIVSEAVSEAMAVKTNYKPGLVVDLAKQWIETRDDANEVTKQNYAKHLRWMCKQIGTNGNKPVSEVDIDEVVRRCKQEDWSSSHKCNTLWCVGAFLRWCGRKETIALPPKDSRSGEAVITDETYRRILVETQGDFRQFCSFLWLTGCRPGEASGLNFELINWDAGTIRLKIHKTRRKGKTRVLYLASSAVQILREQSSKYKNVGLVFRGLQRKRFSLQSLTMRFQRLSDRVGTPVKSYDFRHNAASRIMPTRFAG